MFEQETYYKKAGNILQESGKRITRNMERPIRIQDTTDFKITNAQ